MKSMRVGLILGFTVVLSAVAPAQDSGFFRVVSTQETHIVSFERSGLLVWSNSVPGATCWIEGRRGLDGAWTNNIPVGPVHNNGGLSSIRVPTTGRLEQWIVAFQPAATLDDAEALFESQQMIWKQLGWSSFRMALIYVPHGTSLSNVRGSPLVKYVEADGYLEIF